MPESIPTTDTALQATALFHKSHRSDNSGSCVEVATNHAEAHDRVFVRDTKDRAAAILSFTGAEWTAFIAGVRDGEFDI